MMVCQLSMIREGKKKALCLFIGYVWNSAQPHSLGNEQQRHIHWTDKDNFS